MAINKKLIHFNTKAAFELQLQANNILDTSIVFIKDTLEIYTHGLIYKCNEANILFDSLIKETSPNSDIFTINYNPNHFIVNNNKLALSPGAIKAGTGIEESFEIGADNPNSTDDIYSILSVKTGNGLIAASDGSIIPNLGDGICLENGKISINVGNGMIVDLSNLLSLTLGTGLIVGSNDRVNVNVGTGISFSEDPTAPQLYLKLGTGLNWDEYTGILYSDSNTGVTFGTGFYLYGETVYMNTGNGLTLNDSTNSIEVKLGKGLSFDVSGNILSTVDVSGISSLYSKTAYINRLTSVSGSSTIVNVPYSDFTLDTNIRLIIKFKDATPEVSLPTLNIGGTGDKLVYYNGELSGYGQNVWAANEVCECFYDGTDWQLYPMKRN